MSCRPAVLHWRQHGRRSWLACLSLGILTRLPSPCLPLLPAGTLREVSQAAVLGFTQVCISAALRSYSVG